MSEDDFVNRYWENPDYYFQNLILINRLPYLHDASERPVPIQLIARGIGRLDPIRLHFRTNKFDPFVTLAMSPVGADRVQAKIPPHPPGTRVNYFLSFETPFPRGNRYRHPPRPEENLFYVIRPNVFGEIDEPDVLDIHDLAAVGRVFLRENRNALKPGTILRVKEIEPIPFSSLDFLIQKFSLFPKITLTGVEAQGPQTLRLHLSNGSNFLLPLQKRPRTLRNLVQKEGIDSKPHFAATLYQASPAKSGATWQKVALCGFGGLERILRGSYPCIQRIGPTAIDQESRRNRACLDLAWINLKRDFWKILRASAFRIPRLWVVVGTTSNKQAYQVGGGSILYPLLTLGTLAILALGVFGFVMSRKRWREHLLLTTPVLYLSLVHAPFHVES